MTEITIRKNGKWAKVSGKRGRWIVAKGWAGQFAAAAVLQYPTKDGAKISAAGWVAE